MVSRLRREAGAARRRPRPPCPRARDRPARAGASCLRARRGRNGRAAPADDAGALAPRRSGIRPGSCPRPPRARRATPTDVPSARSCLRVSTLWEDAASDVAAQLAAVGVRVRLLVAASDPRAGWPRSTRARPRLHLGLGRRLPRSGWRLPRSDPPRVSWLYRDERLEQLLARAASLRDQDERLRTYREFERIWIGEQAAVVPLAYGDRLLWRRPWVTGMWANAIARSTFADAVVTRS